MNYRLSLKGLPKARKGLQHPKTCALTLANCPMESRLWDKAYSIRLWMWSLPLLLRISRAFSKRLRLRREEVQTKRQPSTSLQQWKTSTQTETLTLLRSSPRTRTWTTNEGSTRTSSTTGSLIPLFTNLPDPTSPETTIEQRCCNLSRLRMKNSWTATLHGSIAISKSEEFRKLSGKRNKKTKILKLHLQGRPVPMPLQKSSHHATW